MENKRFNKQRQLNESQHTAQWDIGSPATEHLITLRTVKVYAAKGKVGLRRELVMIPT